MAGPLGLPPVPCACQQPDDGRKDRVLGSTLFNDKRFSSTGEVELRHLPRRGQGVHRQPARRPPKGINKLTGTRNAPTVVNAAYFASQFWDGRSADLEDQSQHPFVNPIEMGLKDHEPILKLVRSDAAYVDLFRKAFGIEPAAITMEHVKMAIATFERPWRAVTRRSTSGTSAATRPR